MRSSEHRNVAHRDAGGGAVHSITSVEAATIAEKAAIADIVIDTTSVEVRFTASMGVATYAPADKDFDGLLSHGDQALYEAKHTGRNGIVVV